MTISRNVTLDVALLMDTVGGEPLAGSGFEDEQPEEGFDPGPVSEERFSEGAMDVQD